jgi:aryl-alcohol dehydrogenase-like predicted oxidoreductase
MAELVSAGKVKFLGLSEASPIRSAVRIRSTRSQRCRRILLFARHVEQEILPVLRELGIGFCAPPVGRSFYGTITNRGPDRGRRACAAIPALPMPSTLWPSLSHQNAWPTKNITAGWLLAWYREGEDIAPIPGTPQIPRGKRRAAEIALTPRRSRRRLPFRERNQGERRHL